MLRVGTDKAAIMAAVGSRSSRSSSMGVVQGRLGIWATAHRGSSTTSKFTGSMAPTTAMDMGSTATEVDTTAAVRTGTMVGAGGEGVEATLDHRRICTYTSPCCCTQNEVAVAGCELAQL